VTVCKIAPWRYEHLAHRLKEAKAWRGSRALLCQACPAHVTQRGNRREPVFFEADDYRLYASWSPRRRGAPAPQSGPIA
jgi:hypothetical protein